METKLGRGLAALLGDISDTSLQATELINIDLIETNREQPRKIFDDEKLLELAESISNYGVLQPIAVRKDEDKYKLIAGERRLRAAKLANLSKVPVHIIDCDDNNINLLALIENLQRSDLNAIEEAEALRMLMDENGYTQDEVARVVSKSRSHISNILRMLTLPEEVRELVKNGDLSFGHAKILVGHPDAIDIARQVINEKWSVRHLESFLKASTEKGTRLQEQNKTPIEMSRDFESEDLAERVKNALGVDTKLKITKKGAVFTITCKNCEELESLILKLTSNN
ncbi:MAG: ParB/RepB/Spo0J family partition protein [Alphaproteobacteria bacterium]|nr:ParB/RepB/Spo0J family partition protein [Alphaproteobacteria bacterium]